ncbi:MAG TPA: glycosyltransferase family 2 protein [Kofleriaceae bacterium]
MTAGGAVEISVVVPIYKEERNIGPFLDRMEPVLAQISESYEILFCLDPSPDRTAEVVQEHIARNRRIRLVTFSRRFGQPAATLAGIALSKGDATVVIDVDLQDPPELILAMREKMKEGFDVVYAKRRSRKGETLAKRFISWVGYGVINRLSDVKIPTNTGDFRIMSRRVCEEVTQLNEGHGFLRGLVAFVGFPQAAVEYDRDPRHEGVGNYNRFTGSLRIGLNGIISFGSKPLQMMSVMGFVIAGISFLLGAYYVIGKLLGVAYTPGLPTTVLVVTFFSGVQLLSLGLMGEYVGRIYDEVKRRPKYIIDRQVNFEDEKK